MASLLAPPAQGSGREARAIEVGRALVRRAGILSSAVPRTSSGTLAVHLILLSLGFPICKLRELD